jgi:hypothetical protein
MRKMSIALLMVSCVHAQEMQMEEIQMDSTPVVSCNLYGQLGNQLFQIATTLAYAWDYDAKPIFPELNHQEYRISYNRDHIFFRLDASAAPRPWKNAFYATSESSTERIPFQLDQYLHGYFQCWHHFHHQRDRLLDILSPSPSYLQQIKEKYGDLIDHPNTVSIHVRTGSKHKHETEHFRFVGLDYYRRAVRLFPEDSLFVVFSDRIDWCKNHFGFCKNVVFIEGNDHILDLFLMSMMKHNIMGNSTFSWWGAYLNANPNKMTVVPFPWSHPNVHSFPPNPPVGYFLPDWIVLPVDLNGPYPKDMPYYKTQSIDDR